MRQLRPLELRDRRRVAQADWVVHVVPEVRVRPRVNGHDVLRLRPDPELARAEVKRQNLRPHPVDIIDVLPDVPSQVEPHAFVNLDPRRLQLRESHELAALVIPRVRLDVAIQPDERREVPVGRFQGARVHVGGTGPRAGQDRRLRVPLQDFF